MKIKSVIFVLSIFAASSIFSQTTLPLDTVLKRSMSAAEKYNGLVENYTADVYMRTYVETLKKNFLYKYTHLVPRFVLHDPKSDEAVIETLSTLKFTYPNNYLQNIKNVTGTLNSRKDIDMIPFYLLNINVYGETTNTESFFMPVRFSTAKYYNYLLKQTQVENNKTYYTIEFNPIYDNQKLLKGHFVIESGTWRIVHFSAEGVESFANFSFEITMGDTWITNYLPVDFVIYHTATYLGNVVASRHLASINYNDVVLRTNEKKEKILNISDFFRVRLDSVPVNNDSVFWAENRVIPLQAKEMDVIENFEKKQELEVIKRNNGDSVQSDKRVQQFAQRMVMDSRYSVKSTMIGYSGLLNPLMLGFSSIDGVTYRQKLSFNFDLKRSRTFKINAFAGYMFRRKEFFTDVTNTWNYEPFYHGNVSLSLGIGNPTYSSLFISQIQETLQNRGIKFEDVSVDYFRDYYAKLFNDYELFNGFVSTVGVEYHIRKPRKNGQALPSPVTGEPNPVEDIFVTRKSFAPYLRFSWTPEQYYRYEGRQKIYVRSRYPTFKLELSRSYQNVFGSTSQYNRVEFDISQNIPFGLMNSFQYHVGAGRFVNQSTEYFADFTFFAKNNFPDNWQDGIGGTFNLLNRHLYNASDSYVQAHFMLETPFLIIRNIPLISDYINRERLYVSQLYTPHIVSYTEFGYGVGNRFFKTANAAIFCSFHKTKFREVGVRASFEL
ncbi:DUF5686 family protein [Petrimonas sp.]|uniref:DUF5686 family protein n=1 Tax=Petrimonas sp. TaxID=2023866 RepID=UPI003F5165E9